jgi:hypothetical protein
MWLTSSYRSSSRLSEGRQYVPVGIEVVECLLDLLPLLILAGMGPSTEGRVMGEVYIDRLMLLFGGCADAGLLGDGGYVIMMFNL